MRRTHYRKRTVTIITTTHYTISWEAYPVSSDPTSELDVIVLPAKELSKTIEENQATPHHPDSDQPTSAIPSGDLP